MVSDPFFPAPFKFPPAKNMQLAALWPATDASVKKSNAGSNDFFLGAFARAFACQLARSSACSQTDRDRGAVMSMLPYTSRPPPQKSTFRLLLGGILVVVLVVLGAGLAKMTWSSMRIEFRLEGRTLEVVTGGGGFLAPDRTMTLPDSASLRLVTLSGGRRVGGTAMSGYCTGRFYYPDLGTVWLASDCSRRAVVIPVPDGPPLVLTPASPEAFLADVQRGATAVHRPAHQADPTQLAIVRALGVLPWLVALLLGYILIFLPDRLRYEVEPGILTIFTGFRRLQLPLPGASALVHRPKMGLRLAGAALPGLYTGWFRADGRSVRVFATQLDEVVAIDLEDGGRVFVSPDDPGAFLDALREAGARVEG